MLKLLSAILSVVLVSHVSVAQDVQMGPTGVYWEAPEESSAAAGDLFEMHEVGVERIRTGVVLDQRLLHMADTLGMEWYRDLPAYGLSWSAMSDSLNGLESVLQDMMSPPASGWIGLGQWLNTTDERMCALLETLSVTVKAAGFSTYYVTPYVKHDTCGHAVDMVLLDVRGRGNAFGWLRQYRALHPGVRVGIASAGVPVRAGTAEGHNVEGSTLHQARYMEDTVRQLSDAGETYFLYRWRDGSDPWSGQYGLYTSAGNPREALQVVRGMALGLQQTFALPAAPEERHTSWTVVMGWFLLAFLSALYAGSPRFRSMAPRYFLAHGFYRNAVREAREVLPTTSTALVTIIGLSIGLIGAVFLTALAQTPAGWYLFNLLPMAWRPALTTMVETPLVLTVLLGCVALLSISVWMGLWMFATGLRNPLLPSQALMLGVWPRWQMIALLPVAMVLQSGDYLMASLVLGLVWMVAALWATVRTAIDITRVTRIGSPAAVVIWLLNPEIILLFALFGWAFLHPEECWMMLRLL